MAAYAAFFSQDQSMYADPEFKAWFARMTGATEVGERPAVQHGGVYSRRGPDGSIVPAMRTAHGGAPPAARLVTPATMRAAGPDNREPPTIRHGYRIHGLDRQTVSRL